MYEFSWLRGVCAAALLCLAAPAVSSQQNELPPGLNLSPDLSRYGVSLDADFGFPSQLTDNWTQLHTRVGGVWQRAGYHRTPDGALFFAEDGADAARADYQRLAAEARLGILQGIGWNGLLRRIDWKLFLLAASKAYYHLEAETSDSLFLSAPGADVPFELVNNFILGASHDSTRSRDRITIGGYRELTLEYAPLWLGNQLFGQGNFWRLHARSIQYFPLFLDGLYWVNGTYFDMLLGGLSEDGAIPVTARAAFGGWDSRPGLGDTVRGFGKSRFDTDYKMANAMDIRYQFPAIEALRSAITAIGYWDMGYYRGLRGEPLDNEESIGWISSLGVGLSLTILESYTAAAYTHYAWFGPTVVDGERITPLSIDLGFHQ